MALTATATGCPGSQSGSGSDEEQLYHIGSWYGRLTVEASLVLREDPDYWNAAWQVEATVRLDEFQDGSLSGTAEGDLFGWTLRDELMHPYDEIATGRYESYSAFRLELTGNLDDEGYTINVVELPTMLADTARQNSIIDFWDFLYPSELSQDWPEDGTRVIQGSSIAPQGDDFRETATQTNFRDFSVVYTWNIESI